LCIAACSGPDQDAKKAEQCGFDMLTGYNYHSAGFTVKGQRQIPIDSMISAEYRVWNKFKKLTSLPYIPVSTLNWDPRPWANALNNFSIAPYFVEFSSKSVYRSIKSLSKWIQLHPQETTKEKIALVYAWNEYGEGSWLTPSKKEDKKLLEGLKKALTEKNDYVNK